MLNKVTFVVFRVGNRPPWIRPWLGESFDAANNCWNWEAGNSFGLVFWKSRVRTSSVTSRNDPQSLTRCSCETKEHSSNTRKQITQSQIHAQREKSSSV